MLDTLLPFAQFSVTQTSHLVFIPSIAFQVKVSPFHTILRYNCKFESVADLDMSFRGTGKGISTEIDDCIEGERGSFEWFARLVVLILQIDLVIEEGHDETGRCASGTALFALITTDGIETVDGTHSVLVDSRDDGGDVVREEALAVEHRLNQPRYGIHSHRLCVLMVVPFETLLETFYEGVAISHVPDDRDDDIVANVECPLSITSVDRVPGRMSRVPCNH